MVKGDRGEFSGRALRTLAEFGLTVGDVGLGEGERGRRLARLSRLGERVADEVRAGRAVVVTGASGAGKTTLLGLVGVALESRGWRAVRPARAADFEGRRARAIDVVARACAGRGSRERAMRLLSRAGLSDARLAVMRAGEMSDGERVRLALAVGLARCGDGRGRVLLADEFGAGLDAPTAGSAARGLARWCNATGAGAVVVTHLEGLIGALDARAVVRL